MSEPTTSPVLPHHRITLNVGTPSPTKVLNLSSQSSGNLSSGNVRHSGSKPSSRPPTRSSSLRNKGISMNLAVSPMAVQTTPTPSNYDTHQRSNSAHSSFSTAETPSSSHPPAFTYPSATTVNQHSGPQLHGTPSAEDMRYDVPLPSVEQLVGLDIDDQLRLLALKEMTIVEIKDSIANLNSKLDKQEKEVHKLREIIQRSLYKELSGAGSNTSYNTAELVKNRQRKNSNPRDEAIASTRSRARRRTLSSSSHPTLSPIRDSTGSSQPVAEDSKSSKLWNNLSKPLTLLQQFDTMLQNEFEKSLANSSRDSGVGAVTSTHKPRNSEDSITSVGSASSPLRAKSTKNANYEQLIPTVSLNSANGNESEKYAFKRSSEEVLQTVSSSIWSFVNDVKTNVLSSLAEEDLRSNNHSSSSLSSQAKHQTTDFAPIYNLETGSTVSLNEDSLHEHSINEDNLNLSNLNEDSLNEATKETITSTPTNSDSATLNEVPSVNDSLNNSDLEEILEKSSNGIKNSNITKRLPASSEA